MKLLIQYQISTAAPLELGMDWLFNLNHFNASNYFAMVGIKLISVGVKRDT